ncbi:PKD domain-containing protein [Ekhidna sp. MALMAid0563]|uniref:PKD domain-containing protein n=1 Tax=Ekhidna sp. MALMAid0563 TaxID=3143937 RepID=UPI0032DFC5E2
MNYIKKGISVLLLAALVVSCGDDDSSNPTGLSEIVLSSFEATASGDGTLITVTPLSIGATTYEVDFGDPTSDSDVITIEEQGGSATYDYPNDEEEVTYTISVTAKSEGLADVTISEDVVVIHTVVEPINSAPTSPTLRDQNVFALFSDGFEFNGDLYSWEHGEAATGGTVVTVGDNNIVQFSRLGSLVGTLEVSTVETGTAFVNSAAVTDIHFDVYSDFSEGVDLLKVTLINEGASATYEVDGLALTDGEWTGFDLDLATGFSGAVEAIDEIRFELGTGGTATDHATIYVDNVYLYKETGSEIINGDFEEDNNIWRFPLFSDESTTNPYGSSSDGSDFDINGNDTGDKTSGAKWSSSQSGGIGDFRTSDSRYAYQELILTAGTDYVLEYQYAIREGDEASLDGNKIVGVIMDGFYVDGVDAVNDIASNNLGFYEGSIAEGKFNETVNDYGTFVQIPFTAPSSGEVSVMFYANTAVDAYIDNVKVVEAASATAATAGFTAEPEGGYQNYVFTNTSFNGASFEWDFGDGNTSTEKSPTHTFASDGSYTVQLTAMNAGGNSVTTENIVVADGGATFAAVIQNADFETYPTAENNTNDLVDAWTIDPDNTFNNTSTTPFDWWRNDALEGWVSDDANITGSVTDKASSSSTNAQSAGGSSGRSLKFDSPGERAYQPFEVEFGVEYTISVYIKSEATPITDVEGTFYILHSEPADETDLASFALASVPVTATSVDTWQQVSFDFIASSSFSYPQSRVDESVADGGILTSTDQKFVIFYFVPTNTVSGSNQVWITDVVIETPGF